LLIGLLWMVPDGGELQPRLQPRTVNVQVLGLAAAVRDGRLRFGGGRGVAVVAERGFGDDPGL
jgi:hypothetical protein